MQALVCDPWQQALCVDRRPPCIRGDPCAQLQDGQRRRQVIVHRRNPSERITLLHGRHLSRGWGRGASDSQG